MIDQINCGLNASEIRKHVQFRHPKSVDEAITLAIEYEAFEGPRTILRKPFPDENKKLKLSKILKYLRKIWLQLFQKKCQK